MKKTNKNRTKHGRSGFTLLEMLIALVLLATAMSIAFGAFAGISRAWQRGLAMSDHLNHGEYGLELITLGLRSAFHPRGDKGRIHYGFVLENNGDGPDALDKISWVKTGSALLSANDQMRLCTHRIMLSVEPDEFGDLCLASRAWLPQILLSRYDPLTMIEPFFLTSRITGMDCRVSTNYTDGKWEWQNLWTDEATNTLPVAVEITVYFEPLEKGDEPVAVRRFVEIPAAARALGAAP